MVKVEANNKKNVKLKFYGEIGTWWNNGTQFSNFFSQYDGKYEIIDIHLHCYGGQVFEGNLIWTTLAQAESTVNVHVDGIAASMGSIFVQAGTKRTMVENGFIMVHVPSGLTVGNAKDHLSSAKLLRSMEQNFIKKLAERTTKTEDEVKEWFDGADHWFSAEEAKEIGLIDEIVNPVVKDIRNLERKEAENLGAEDVYNRFAAQLIDNANNFQTKKSKMDKQNLIARYNLTGVTAESSEEDILKAIDNKLSAEAKAREEAEDKLKSQQQSAVKSLIDQAIADGKISKESKETYEAIADASGVDTLKSALEAIPKPTTITSQLGKDGKKGGEERNNWSFDDYQDKDPQALEDMKEEDWESFSQLYKNKFGTNPEK